MGRGSFSPDHFSVSGNPRSPPICLANRSKHAHLLFYLNYYLIQECSFEVEFSLHLERRVKMFCKTKNAFAGGVSSPTQVMML